MCGTLGEVLIGGQCGLSGAADVAAGQKATEGNRWPLAVYQLHTFKLKSNARCWLRGSSKARAAAAVRMAAGS